MPHGAKGEVDIWDEFAANGEALAFESERLLAERMGHDIEASVETSDLADLEGREREAIVRTRVNQSYFRRMVLTRYDDKCCVTSLATPELLVASPIVPWAEAPAERMNPRNGLSLNALHDRAFDRGLLTATNDLHMGIAPSVREGASAATSDFLLRFDEAPLKLPDRFAPDRGSSSTIESTFSETRSNNR